MKKLLAIVISMAMVLAMLPVGVFADGEKQITANSHELTSGNYILMDDVTLSYENPNTAIKDSPQPISGQLEVPEGATVIIDLNGKVLTCTYEGISILNRGTLIIKDSSAIEGNKGTGRIYNNNREEISYYGHDVIRNLGNLTIESGTFGDNNLDETDENANITTGAALRNIGTATINGGYFTCTDNYPDNKGWSYAIRSAGTLTINGGKVYGSMNGGISADSGTVTINNVEVNIFGEKSYACLATSKSEGEFIVHGGKFIKSGNDNPILNSFSGMPSWDATEDLAANGYNIDGGTFIVNDIEQKIVPVAKIGDKGYPTLAAAIESTNAKETITLLDDITLTKKLTIQKPVTIDGAGHTITIANDSNEHLMELTANATIKNVTLDSANKAKGINTYGAGRDLAFVFENVKMLNSKGTGLTAKGGNVTLNNVEISGSAWKQSIDISNSNNNELTNGANLTIDSKCVLGDELPIVYDRPDNDKVGTITATVWVVSSEDKAFGEGTDEYTKRIFTLTKPVVPSTPSTPTDNVTNADKSTTADLNPAVSDNKANTTVDADTAAKIVDKAVANKSTEVIIDAAAGNNVAASEVGIPEATVKELSEKTDANLVIKTDNGKVDLDKTALDAVAAQAGTTGTVKLIVETVKTDANICHVDLKLVTSNGNVTDFRGGNVKVTVSLNKELAGKELVCVYINDNGIYTKVDGVLNADGTYTFTTGHFSEYAVMAKDEADKAIADQLNTLTKEVKLTARTSKTAKKNIKVTVNGDVTALKDAGYTVKYKFYRSTKKASKYTAKVTKDTNTYTNTTGKKGTKYYYKAKVLVYDGDTLVAQTALKQCKYGARFWTK